jgi:glycerol-3-phosphate dehydrogenase
VIVTFDQQVPKWLAEHKEIISPELLICNTAKGLYLEENCLLSDAINRILGREQPYVILSGPSFAKEMMIGYPTAGIVCW